MDAATELFRHEFGSYPRSDANDLTGKPFCGAMKLAEALRGQDLLGIHSKSVFRRDGMDATGTIDLYPDNIDKLESALRDESLKARKGPYLSAENAHAWRLADIYGEGNTGPFPEDTYVLCDVFEQERSSGKKTGMPILYYAAKSAGSVHRADETNTIYVFGCADNQSLVALGVPGKPSEVHPLIDPKRFRLNTHDPRFSALSEPCRLNLFILISAGRDGLYGTADDVCNFDWKYRER
jgi:hypothetical protein